MNTTGGALSFDAYISDTDFNKTIQSMNQKIIGLTKTTQTEAKKTASAFGDLGRLAAGAFAGTQLAQLPGQIIKVRGEFQKLEIAFSTMLGSKAKTDALMQDIIKAAAETPFGLQDLATGAKQLLAFGGTAGNVVNELKTLGDVAAGVSAPIGDLVYLYGTLRTQGRAFTIDIRQFASRGIPIYDELAKVLKKDKSELNALVEAGKVGFPEIEQAFKNMTSEGGMFFNLMKAQSESLPGQLERLSDAVDNMFNQIGKSNENTISGIIKGGAYLIEHYKDVIDILEVLVVAYGAYRAAVMLSASTSLLAGLSASIQMWVELAAMVNNAKDAQILFNLATNANPYILLGTAIAGLIAWLVLFKDDTDEAAEALERLNTAIDNELAKTKTLTDQIQNENISRDTRNQKLKELIALSPAHLSALTLDNAKTAEGQKMIKAYNDELVRKMKLKDLDREQTEANLKKQQAQEGKFKPGFWEGLAVTAESMAGQYRFTKGANMDKNAAALRADVNKEIEKQADAELKAIDDKRKALEAQGEAAKLSGEEQKKAIIKNVAFYENEIKRLNDLKGTVETPAQGASIQRQIAAAEAAKRRLLGESTAERTKREKAEAKAAAAAAKEESVKSFADELEEKRRLYELYESWILSYGEQAANEQFNTLIKSNKNYLAYLNAEIARLTAVRDSGEMSYGDAADLTKLNEERDRVTGGIDPLEALKKQLDAAEQSAESLTEALINVNRIKAGLNPNDNTALGQAKRGEVAEREKAINLNRAKLLQDFLLNTIGTEQKRLEITKHYADLREEAEKHARAGNVAGHAKMLAQINEAEAKELENYNEEVLKNSAGYKELEKIVELSAKNTTAIRLQAARDQLASTKEKLGEEAELYKSWYNTVIQLEEQLRRETIEKWQAIAGAVDALGQAMQDLGGAVGEVGAALSGISGSVGSVAEILTIKEGEKVSATQYANAIQSVISMIGLLISAQKKRREAEKQFAAERLGFENEYQQSLIKSAQDDYGHNPFYTDYTGKIDAGVKAYEIAAEKYDEAINKLNEGRAKDRQKNAIDGKSVGQMAGAGAIAGGLAGSIIPGLGNIAGAAIGAGIGAVAGLFARKKKDVYGSLMEMYPDLVKETADGWSEINVEMANALINSNQVDDKTKELLTNALALNDAMQEAKQQMEDVAVELTGQIGNQLKDALVEAFEAGNTAAEALHQTVSDIIKDVVTKMLFSAIVGPALDRLQKEITEGQIKGKPLAQVLADSQTYLKPAVEGYFESLDAANEWAKSAGFEDMFGRSQGNDQAMQGVIKGVSEETVSVLIGQTNAIRIYQAQMSNTLLVSVGWLEVIASNTSYNKYLTRLESIDNKLTTLNNSSMRAYGT